MLMRVPMIPLRFPWSLYGDARPLEDREHGALPASGTLALALPEGCRLQSVRHPHQPCNDGSSFQWDGQQWQRWQLPAASVCGDEELTLRIIAPDGSSIIRRLRISGNLGHYDHEHHQDAANGRALDREILIAVIVDLIAGFLDIDPDEQAAQGRMRGWVRTDWRRVASVLAGERDVSEPRMALIVRHARDLHRLVGELGRHPRRVLARDRRLQPVHRIQEMDSACLAWYVRQRGAPRSRRPALARRYSPWYVRRPSIRPRTASSKIF